METNISKNLPTDNLYKFLALFGLALFISSFFIPDWYNEKIWDYREYLQKEQENYETRIESSLSKMEMSVNSIVDSRDKLLDIINENKDIYSEQELKESIVEYREMQQQVSESYDKLISTIKTSQEGVNSFNESLLQINKKRTDEWIKESGQLTKFCLIAGLVLMIAGFILWYKKTQRYLDWILREKGEKFKRDNNTGRLTFFLNRKKHKSKK